MTLTCQDTWKNCRGTCRWCQHGADVIICCTAGILQHHKWDCETFLHVSCSHVCAHGNGSEMNLHTWNHANTLKTDTESCYCENVFCRNVLLACTVCFTESGNLLMPNVYIEKLFRPDSQGFPTWNWFFLLSLPLIRPFCFFLPLPSFTYFLPSLLCPQRMGWIMQCSALIILIIGLSSDFGLSLDLRVNKKLTFLWCFFLPCCSDSRSQQLSSLHRPGVRLTLWAVLSLL